MRRALHILFGLLAAVAIFVCAVPPRLYQLRREFWLDEATQSVRMLHAGGLWELRTSIFLHAAPILDFALRRFVWFPVVGHQELGLRLPGLFYSLAAVVLVALVTRAVLRERGPAYAAAGALVAAMWCATQSQEVYYAAEARLYALASLLSMAWVACFLFGRREWLFALVSCLYLEAHFWAVPLVTAGYAWHVIAALRAARWRQAGRLLATYTAMIALLAWLNQPALTILTLLPRVTQAPVDASAWRGLKILWEQQATFELPGAPFLVWLALALGAGLLASRRMQAARLALLVALLLPMYVVFGRSTLYFPARYSMPVYGIAFGVLLLGLAAVADLLARYRPRAQPLALIAVCALAVPLAAKRARLPGRWSLPPQNFSERFRFFEEVKTRADALLAVSSPCWGDAVPELYWKYLGTPARAFVGSPYDGDERCRLTPFAAGTPLGARMDEFLRGEPRGAVVLNQVQQKCPAPTPSSTLEVRRFEIPQPPIESCSLLILGARDRQEIDELAARAGFPIK